MAILVRENMQSTYFDLFCGADFMTFDLLFTKARCVATMEEECDSSCINLS